MSGRQGQKVRAGRRRFLQAFAAFAGVALASAFAPLRTLGRARAPQDAERELARELAGLFRSPERARALGRRVLALHPETADVRPLRARLGAGGAELAGATLRERLAELRRRDFAQGRILRVDGWVLARCEAEVCALLGLG